VLAQADASSLLESVPACRHAAGTISSSGVPDVWRVVSEDSDQLGPGLTAIHRLRYLRDLDQTFEGPMLPDGDELDAARELLEVLLLGGPERVIPKERDDPAQEVCPPPHDVAIQMLAMVVPSSIGHQHPHAEELLESAERTKAAFALGDRELMRHLIAGPVGASAPPAALADEPDREASFSVYKTNNPAQLNQPFLLIVRTDGIVTAHDLSLGRVPVGYTGFSSI
jgi:hypothetical protein